MREGEVTTTYLDYEAGGVEALEESVTKVLVSTSAFYLSLLLMARFAFVKQPNWPKISDFLTNKLI